MHDPANKNLRRVMSDDWTRRLPPKRNRTDGISRVLVVFAALAVVAVIAGAAFGAAMEDARSMAAMTACEVEAAMEGGR